jgi:tetratricopeptide (TPR) repeat protein
MQDVREATFSKISMRLTRAERKDVLEEEQTDLWNLALAEIEKLRGLNDERVNIPTDLLHCEVLTQMGDFASAVELYQATYKLCEEAWNRSNRMNRLIDESEGQVGSDQEEDFDAVYEKLREMQKEGPQMKQSDFVDVGIEMAHTQQKLGDWSGAITTFQTIFGKFPEPDMMTPPQQRKIFMGISRSLFEVGTYDGAISVGEGAIEMNRHFPGVHKYVAASLKAKGDMESANQLLCRAALYEAPWDEEHVAKTRQEWQDFQEFLKK